MRKLILLLLFLSVKLLYAEMPCIEVDLYTDDSGIRNFAYNYIVNQSSNFIWNKQERLEKYIIGGGTAPVVYRGILTVRVPQSKLPLAKKLLEGATKYAENNKSNILSGTQIRYHRCFNEGIPGRCEPCIWKILWQK